MEEQTQIKCKYFFLQPSTECLEGMPDVQYFDILNTDRKVIDTFDYIRMSDPKLAVDLRNGEFRVFPWMSKAALIYDTETHEISVCEE